MCGKRTSNLSYATSTRSPIKNNDIGYSCQAGFKACNEAWLTDAESAKFVVCIAENKSFDECPITSFAFTLDGMNITEASLY